MNLQKSGFFLTAFFVSKVLAYKFPDRATDKQMANIP